MTKIVLSASRDIPLNKLVLSQANVRRIKAGVSVEELAEDIARRGLLQSLSVRPGIPFSFPGWQHHSMARPVPTASTCAGSIPTGACGGSIRLPFSRRCSAESTSCAGWGRIGTIGSSLIRAFPDEPSAQAALDTLAERKRAGAATSDPRIPRRSVPLSPARTSLT